ncbi:MAG: outer membrane beta-barrel protein [Alphaproteobacteria bacterium]|jgi:opacity protein-like surface antigen|nr:outer membrane beta-barrel protein [Alphaproteobacteria bacterium]MBT5390203.1 outer membrane beta-barrel protein [Alphaproteobacteria bacterium]MBT5654974.1 outer membrane beta-barrel protein [Alphaproteobacteria bacterium]
MKKISKICCVLSLAISCISISQHSEAKDGSVVTASLNGWYAGFGAGYQHLKSNGSAKFRLTGAGNFSSANNELKENGFLAEIHGGYSETQEDSLYYGGKLLLNISTAQASNKVEFTNAEFENKFKQDVNGSVLAQFGFLADSDTAIYGTLGVSYSYFTYKHVETGSTDSKWKVGFPFGLGVRTSIEKDVSLSVEGIYTIYSSFSTGDLDGSDVDYIAKASPRTFALTIGVITPASKQFTLSSVRDL